MIRRIGTIILLSIISLKANITPTDVYIEAKSVKLAIASMVNKEVGSSLLPVVDIDLKNAEPMNSYALGIALNEKIRVQMHLKGISGWSPKSFPKEKIIPKDLKELMSVLQKNLKKLDPSIEFKRESASNKTPPDVMQELIFASLWMDKFLRVKAKPNYSHQIVKKIDYEIKAMMRDLGIEEVKTNFQKYPKVTPRDVFLNAQNIYATLISFDRVKLGRVHPQRPYDIVSSGIKVMPVDVFTSAVYILNYLYTLKQELGFKINEDYSPKHEAVIKPNQIYILYDKIHFNIMQILSNLGGKK